MLETNYLDTMQDLLETGELIENDRTGVGIYSKFGKMLRWDLSQGFPAITTKKLAWNAVVSELLWFLHGSTNVETLRDITHGKGSTKRTIWDDNYENQAQALGYTHGELGPVYGKQWRNFGGVDQVLNLISQIKVAKATGVHNRRMLVSAWNVAELDKMALPPCHYGFQCYLHNNKLSLMWTQRSVDVFLGLPFNMASYGLLVHILCMLTGTEPGELVVSMGDYHIYTNHFEQCMEQLSRDPLPAPTLDIPIATDLDTLLKYPPELFFLVGYKSHGTIKAPMAV